MARTRSITGLAKFAVAHCKLSRFITFNRKLN
jgi:hypothetical protein